MSDALTEVGLYGLAVMGQNFALNMASKGFKVSVCNRSPAKVDATVERAAAEGNLPLFGHKDPKDFVASIQKPRRIILLVQAGQAVDDTIALLAQYMEAGDVLVDGGNEWFLNSIRRAKELESKGIHYVGMGISGGEEGARTGPSLMPGGPLEAYQLLHPILAVASAQVVALPNPASPTDSGKTQNAACVSYFGGIGSGNYVKMVHNGIEYGDMQLIAEIYDILKTVARCTNEEMSQIFREWNNGELESFLIDITATILNTKDDLTESTSETPKYLMDFILDKTGMKGTGRWTVQEGAERSVPIPTIAAALDARCMSGRKDERVAASSVLEGPDIITTVQKTQLIEDCKHALYSAKCCSYAQGFCLIQAASTQNNWNIDISECARIWQGGCIIRAAFLSRILLAYTKEPTLPNLLVAPDFAADMNRRQASWRRVVSLAIASGIPCPALASSVTYYDMYRRALLPANLTQAQRDFFGGHSYQRTDREGDYHARWTEAHQDIGDVGARNAGNLP